jgi:hypothetical protein
MDKYWNENEQELCIVIANSEDHIEINNNFNKLFKPLQKMFDSIFGRYFYTQPELRNKAARDDIFLVCMAKVYVALKNKYNTTKSSFSFCSAVIKHSIIDQLRRNSKDYQLGCIEDINLEDTGDDDVKLDYSELLDEVKILRQNSNSRIFNEYLNYIIDILETDFDENIHRYLFSYVVTTTCNITTKGMYTTLLNNTPEHLQLQRLAISMNKKYLAFNTDSEDYNTINNELYLYDVENNSKKKYQ